MNDTNIHIGAQPVRKSNKRVTGEFVDLEGEEFYRIGNYDLMHPFFMTVVSHSDHWMFISSTGGATAGRINPDHAFFPYQTDDKIHDAAGTSGPKTLLHVQQGSKTYLWEPLSGNYRGAYAINRNLYKNTRGNKLVFEEENTDLDLIFRYAWMPGERFGWIRKCELINTSGTAASINVLDGIQNILPYGIQQATQAQFSTLMDAYKRSERIGNGSLALYSLSSIPVDRAEPSEALKATTVWSTGLPVDHLLLSSNQLDDFRFTASLRDENDVKGQRGAYFIHSQQEILPAKNLEWYIVADVNKDVTDVHKMLSFIKEHKKISEELNRDVYQGTQNLRSIVDRADGFQKSADKLMVTRHYFNVLFNVMRGGIFADGYTLSRSNLLQHIEHCNTEIYRKYSKELSSLPEKIGTDLLFDKAQELGDPDLTRLCREYLPLTFSRRHGDPSRPWNRFSINLKNPDGSRKLYYQGNWRDIFQNWEALAYSYPGFIRGMICKFLNASTIDGYNPYRITRDGMEWEIYDPSDPWSNIGYWGDHQVIYLLKLLELSEHFYPGQLSQWFNKDIFTYADVPYRIRIYEDILRDPQNTIVFDEQAEKWIEGRVQKTGQDGKLVHTGSGDILKANLIEKLLLMMLTKVSNFIPGAGIWMNTQRPEWNDANNALVGYGVSMVTLYYLRRFTYFLEQVLVSESSINYRVAVEVGQFFYAIVQALQESPAPRDGKHRRTLMDRLGKAGSDYRNTAYEGFSGSGLEISATEILDFLHVLNQHLDRSITVNRREDQLYHSYNLIEIRPDKVDIRFLPEMLEGQVAVLSSGKLSGQESVEILDALANSSLYRKDQDSYILYPDKQLPAFLEKNNIPDHTFNDSKALKKLAGLEGQTIIRQDIHGHYHFNGTFRNRNELRSAMNDKRDKSLEALTDRDKDEILEVYEQVFDHRSFTGRSGTFYKYEGLGCIYWHMVSKLLLVVGELVTRTQMDNEPRVLNALKKHFNNIQTGLGVHKGPEQYGSFPFDPYSHTPSMMGVQQPGMTGQVKEDIISRFIQLGVQIEKGQLSFDPVLLDKHEFNFNHVTEEKDTTVGQSGSAQLRFSYCGIPVVYSLTEKDALSVDLDGSQTIEYKDLTLDPETSRLVFKRSDKVKLITVGLGPDHFGH